MNFYKLLFEHKLPIQAALFPAVDGIPKRAWFVVKGDRLCYIDEGRIIPSNIMGDSEELINNYFDNTVANAKMFKEYWVLQDGFPLLSTLHKSVVGAQGEPVTVTLATLLKKDALRALHDQVDISLVPNRSALSFQPCEKNGILSQEEIDDLCNNTDDFGNIASVDLFHYRQKPSYAIEYGINVSEDTVLAIVSMVLAKHSDWDSVDFFVPWEQTIYRFDMEDRSAWDYIMSCFSASTIGVQEEPVYISNSSSIPFEWTKDSRPFAGVTLEVLTDTFSHVSIVSCRYNESAEFRSFTLSAEDSQYNISALMHFISANHSSLQTAVLITSGPSTYELQLEWGLFRRRSRDILSIILSNIPRAGEYKITIISKLEVIYGMD